MEASQGGRKSRCLSDQIGDNTNRIMRQRDLPPRGPHCMTAHEERDAIRDGDGALKRVSW